MPFKSQAQRRKFAELLLKGEISAETFEEWNRETGSARLPERVKSRRRKAKKKGTAATNRKPHSKSKTSRKPATKRKPRSRVARKSK
jgi:hypothetical protein